MPLKRFSDLLLVCCCVFGVPDDYLLAQIVPLKGGRTLNKKHSARSRHITSLQLKHIL